MRCSRLGEGRLRGGDHDVLLKRLRGRVAEQTSLDRIIDVLDLLGSIFFLVAAILAFFVPSPAVPPPPVSGDGPPFSGRLYTDAK